MITFIESGNRIATENFEIGEIYTIAFTNGNYKTMCCIGVGSDFVMFQDKLPNALFCLTLGTAETVSRIDIGGGGSTMNYNELENKPQINGIVLIGNKTSSDLGLLSQADLDNYVTDTELTTELADYATNASVVSALASKQDQLTTPQLTAVNSGITSSLVTQIGTNTTAIAGKQDTLTTPQITAVNSGITNPLVTQITTNQNNISLIEQSGIHKNNLSLSLAEMKSINASGQGATWSDNVCTINGVTFTVNDDYTITVGGQLSGSDRALFKIFYNRPNTWGGQYLVGCPSGGSTTTYKLNMEMNGSPWSGISQDTGSGSRVGTATTNNIYGYIDIYQTGALNLLFKPMIITEAMYNAGFTDYQQYAPTMGELYQMILALS